MTIRAIPIATWSRPATRGSPVPKIETLPFRPPRRGNALATSVLPELVMNLSFDRRTRAWRRLFSLTLPAAIALGSFSASTAPAAIPPSEKLLPDDTLMMVTTPDFAKLRGLYRTAPQLQLWNDPAMKPFRDKFMSRLNDELLEPLERELGVQFDDYTNLPQGQLTFAVTQNG